jgi:hypothetical protein
MRGWAKRLEYDLYPTAPCEGHLCEGGKKATVRPVVVCKDEILFMELLRGVEEVFEQLD